MITNLPIRVLIIDDSQDSAERLILELKQHQYEPIYLRINTLAKFDSAIETQEWDIILCENKLKNFTCIDFINLLHDKWLDIPVIAVSGETGDESLSSCMKAGANDFVFWDKLGRLVPAIERELSYAEIRKEHNKAKRTIRTNEEYFKNIIETSLDGIIAVNFQGNIILFNQSAVKLFQYAPAEVLNQPMTVLMLPGNATTTAKADDGCREKFLQQLNKDIGSSDRTECLFQRKDGTTFEAEAAFSVGRDDKGFRLMVISLHNVNKQKQMENKLRQVQKLEAIALLAGGVAHDFNNYLTVMLGYADVIINDEEIQAPVKEKVLNIRKAAENAAALTQQLLAFSRKQNIQPKIVNPNKLIADKEKMIRTILGENIKLAVDLDTHLANIKVDPSQFEQIVMNLVFNARDAMAGACLPARQVPSSGPEEIIGENKLIIKTENVSIDEEYCVQNPEAKAGNFIRLSVEDTGSGISKETIPHIFEPFFTTKEPGRGTGLGLSVVYGIVRQHNGWINVYSEPGQGTIFRTYLPVTVEKTVHETQKTISFSDFKGQGERILLLEDDAKIREFASSVLRKNGYDVFECASGAEAVSTFKKEKGRFHLIFSDVVLTDTNGLRLANDLLVYNPKISVLFSSGYIDYKSQWDEISKRGFKFLQKPYAVVDLLSSVRELVSPSDCTKVTSVIRAT